MSRKNGKGHTDEYYNDLYPSSENEYNESNDDILSMFESRDGHELESPSFEEDHPYLTNDELIEENSVSQMMDLPGTELELPLFHGKYHDIEKNKLLLVREGGEIGTQIGSFTTSQDVKNAYDNKTNTITSQGIPTKRLFFLMPDGTEDIVPGSHAVFFFPSGMTKKNARGRTYVQGMSNDFYYHHRQRPYMETNYGYHVENSIVPIKAFYGDNEFEDTDAVVCMECENASYEDHLAGNPKLRGMINRNTALSVHLKLAKIDQTTRKRMFVAFNEKLYNLKEVDYDNQLRYVADIKSRPSFLTMLVTGRMAIQVEPLNPSKSTPSTKTDLSRDVKNVLMQLNLGDTDRTLLDGFLIGMTYDHRISETVIGDTIFRVYRWTNEKEKKFINNIESEKIKVNEHRNIKNIHLPSYHMINSKNDYNWLILEFDRYICTLRDFIGDKHLPDKPTLSVPLIRHVLVQMAMSLCMLYKSTEDFHYFPVPRNFVIPTQSNNVKEIEYKAQLKNELGGKSKFTLKGVSGVLQIHPSHDKFSYRKYSVIFSRGVEPDHKLHFNFMWDLFFAFGGKYGISALVTGIKAGPNIVEECINFTLGLFSSVYDVSTSAGKNLFFTPRARTFKTEMKSFLVAFETFSHNYKEREYPRDIDAICQRVFRYCKMYISNFD